MDGCFKTVGTKLDKSKPVFTAPNQQWEKNNKISTAQCNLGIHLGFIIHHCSKWRSVVEMYLTKSNCTEQITVVNRNKINSTECSRD